MYWYGYLFVCPIGESILDDWENQLRQHIYFMTVQVYSRTKVVLIVGWHENPIKLTQVSPVKLYKLLFDIWVNQIKLCHIYLMTFSVQLDGIPWQRIWTNNQIDLVLYNLSWIEKVTHEGLHKTSKDQQLFKGRWRSKSLKGKVYTLK